MTNSPRLRQLPEERPDPSSLRVRVYSRNVPWVDLDTDTLYYGEARDSYIQDVVESDQRRLWCYESELPPAPPAAPEPAIINLRRLSDERPEKSERKVLHTLGLERDFDPDLDSRKEFYERVASSPYLQLPEATDEYRFWYYADEEPRVQYVLKTPSKAASLHHEAVEKGIQSAYRGELLVGYVKGYLRGTEFNQKEYEAAVKQCGVPVR
jgi:hypothetical protein